MPVADHPTKFCYIIFSHTAPQSVLRLVQRIRVLSPTAAVVVRFEKTGFLDVAAVEAAGAIPLESRIRTAWGTISLVDMTLEALSFARQRTSATHFVTISGQCYPVRHLGSWERELLGLGTCDALINRNSGARSPEEDHSFSWRAVELPRIRVAVLDRAVKHLGWRLGVRTRRWLAVMPLFDPMRNLWFIGVRRRRYSGTGPDGLAVIKASQWMVLSRRAIEKVLAAVASDGPPIDFLRSVRVPDEGFIQSLVLHDDSLRVHPGITSSAIFLPDRPSPEWVSAEHLPAHMASGAPFIRKLPPDVDPSVLEAADLSSWQEEAAP